MRGYGAVLEALIRRTPRLTAWASLGYLPLLCLVPAQLGFVERSSTNVEQLETLRTIEAHSAPDDVAIDSEGSALFRPDRGYHWYQGAAHVVMFDDYYQHAFVPDLRQSRALSGSTECARHNSPRPPSITSPAITCGCEVTFRLWFLALAERARSSHRAALSRGALGAITSSRARRPCPGRAGAARGRRGLMKQAAAATVHERKQSGLGILRARIMAGGHQTAFGPARQARHQLGPEDVVTKALLHDQHYVRRARRRQRQRRGIDGLPVVIPAKAAL